MVIATEVVIAKVTAIIVTEVILVKVIAMVNHRIATKRRKKATG